MDYNKRLEELKNTLKYFEAQANATQGAIKVADASLSINHGTFCIRTSDIKNVAKLIKTSWCTQNLQENALDIKSE